MIEQLLAQGANNTRSTAYLLRITGLRTPRELRAQVERERRQGALILSTRKRGGGYFLPSEGEEGRLETERFCRFFAASATSTLHTLHLMQRGGEVTGQLEIGGETDGSTQNVRQVNRG